MAAALREGEKDVKEKDHGPFPPKFSLELNLSGKLGTFYDRDATTHYPTEIELIAVNFRNAIRRTLSDVIITLLNKKSHTICDLTHLATTHSTQLANGVVVLTYCKLRALNSLIPGFGKKFHRNPMINTTDFEIPQPYAVAISQLGMVRTKGLPKEALFTPSMSANDAANFGLPENLEWSAWSYANSVEFAKSIGMKFAVVDLSTKMGSTWWLLEQPLNEDILSLHCLLPGANFSTSTSLLHNLFCVTESEGFFNPIFRLDPLGDANYGTMVLNPRDRIDLNVYFAVEGVEETP